MAEFNKVWKILQTADSLMGNYVMVSPDHKLSKFQRIYRWMWLIGFVLPLIPIVSTIYAKRSDFSLLLQAATMFEQLMTAIPINLNIILHKKSIMKVLEWCTETQVLDNVHMNRARTLLVKLTRRFAIGYALSFFLMTILPMIIGQILPEDIYPKFRPPQPFELAIEDRDNWTIYLITSFMQNIGVFYGSILPYIYICFYSTFCIIFYAYLNTMLDDIHQISATWATNVEVRSNHDGKIWKHKMCRIVDKYCEGFE